MWDSSADHKHNTVLLLFLDAIDPLGPAGFKETVSKNGSAYSPLPTCNRSIPANCTPAARYRLPPPGTC